MISISPVLLVLTIAVFLVLYFLLKKWLYTPLLTFMEERDASIKGDLRNAQGNSDEVQALQSEAEAILGEARKKANSIREEAHHQAQESLSLALRQKSEELEREYLQFVSELEQEGVVLKNALLSQMPLYKESLKAKISRL